MLNETAIAIRTNSVWVSKRVAEKLLTPGQIEKAQEEGKLRSHKRDEEKQNGRWDFNLWDLLKLCDIHRRTRLTPPAGRTYDDTETDLGEGNVISREVPESDVELQFFGL